MTHRWLFALMSVAISVTPAVADSFTVTVPEGGVGADFARRWGLLPIPVSSWARMVPITDRLPAMVAMIANREIDMNSGFIGLFLFAYYISSSRLWPVKFKNWTGMARCLFDSLFLKPTFPSVLRLARTCDVCLA